MNISELLFALIRNELKGEELSSDVLSSLNDENLRNLYSLSDFHNCAHLLFNPISKSGVVSKDNEHYKKFQKKQMLALFQVSQIEHEIERIEDCLKKHEISYILLKGSVLRNLYPESWMRTSCDIDILVHEEDLDNAAQFLKDELNYIRKGYPEFHDISLYSENGIQLELHFNIKEDIESLDALLEKVWDYAKKETDSSEYTLENEYLLFHIVSHTAYHFVSGGCGIRPFIDLWFIHNYMEINNDRFYELLKQCSLVTFYENSMNLSDVWMNNREHTDITRRMEKYIFSGGTYGTKLNSISLRTSKKKSKFSYMLSRAFPPFSSLKIRYPVLKKMPFLAPFYWIIRLFGSVFGKKNNKTAYEIKTAMNIDEERNNEILDLINTLELKDG